MDDYVVHPAFTFGEDELAGFWGGKFETSNTEGYGADNKANNSNLTAQIKGGVTSWRNITISNMYDVCLKINNNGNKYGIVADDSKVDPHMMKNIEWGAVGYLSKSIYGKNSEVTINNSSNYYTGGSGTAYRNNVNQSTTGNIFGVYDMSGGAWEYVAAYVGNGNSYGSSLVSASAKYKDVYAEYQEPLTSRIYGDAIYETSNSSSSSSNSWYIDYSEFPVSSSPFLERGGHTGYGSGAGLFAFSHNYGGGGIYSFRIVIPVL